MTVVLFAASGAEGEIVSATPVFSGPGSLFVVYATGPADLAEELTVEVLDGDGDVVSTSAAGAIAAVANDPAEDEQTYAAHVAAPPTSGPYTVRWRGPEPDQVVTEPLTVTILPSWAPTLEDVAALVPAYTRRPVDQNVQHAGQEAGFFDAPTNPSALDVMALISVPDFGVLEVGAKNVEVPPSADLDELIEVGAVHHGPLDSVYESKTVPELEELAAARGLEVKGTGTDGNVLKADLVAALDAADIPTTSEED